MALAILAIRHLTASAPLVRIVNHGDANHSFYWQSLVPRVPAIARFSVGVYRLPPGATDSQRPHGEDELYYVLAGRASFTSGHNTVQAEPGVCLFVPAHEPHRFHDIVERLEVLVVFGPAEGTRP